MIDSDKMVKAEITRTQIRRIKTKQITLADNFWKARGRDTRLRLRSHI